MISGSEVGAFIDRPALALRPVREPTSGIIEAWEARADLPWHYQTGKSPSDVAMASLHRSPVSSQAVVGACLGALELGEVAGFSTVDAMDRMEAIADACDGCDWEELAGEYGEDIADDTMEVVGKLGFRKLGKFIKKSTRGLGRLASGKLVRGVISMVPGIGPVASTALDMASPALQKIVKQGGTKSLRRRPKKRKASSRRRSSSKPKRRSSGKSQQRIVRATCTFPFPR
jgi:hypothetical protein